VRLRRAVRQAPPAPIDNRTVTPSHRHGEAATRSRPWGPLCSAGPPISARLPSHGSSSGPSAPPTSEPSVDSPPD